MNLTLFGAIALFAFVSDTSAQLGPAPAEITNLFAPPAAASGWLIGQESSKNAVNVAVNNAISKVNVTELPPELQQELQQALVDAEFGLASCDDLLLSPWSIWRYKICKFQELAKLKLKIQEIKLKAQAYVTSTTTPATTSTFQTTATAQSSSVAA
ncbi:uncharacterized protein LOC129576485 [Sitodiplosis mosellana]|uniref:uncharacterized protein LOC129576485 n=1 Tax=Sitodiplosis mosellana TaxID=263140 RepID=UPI002444CEB6|nr:uncharacterized protein LOC129576485 [Sitodiplosis mosellana]